MHFPENNKKKACFFYSQHSYYIKSAKRLFFNFFSGIKLYVEKAILSDIVLRKQNARALRAALPVELRSKIDMNATGSWD